MNRARRQFLELLADIESGRAVTPERARALKAQLAPRRPRKVPTGPTRRQEKRAADAAGKAQTAEIRAICLERAGGYCECGCGRALLTHGCEMDHFDGGSGKRQRQRVESCWILAVWCHRQRQANRPSVEEWNARFARHCNRHGYPVLQHIVHARLPR